MPGEEDSDHLTTAQAAARLGVAPNSVIVWADAGLLQSWRTPGGHRRITAASVRSMLEKRREREAAMLARPLRVMVVEDNDAMAQLLAGQIRQVLPVASVSTVGDGFEALVQAGKDLPDVILMDVNLPGMNGLAMIRSLRSQFPSARLRFVLVSSFLPHELKPFGERPLDVPFLPKPVSIEALQEALSGLLEN